MSLITIVQDACAELSLPSLATVVGNDVSNGPMMLRLAKDELNSLAGRSDWVALLKNNVFFATSTAVQVTASALPTDLDRLVNDSFFNRTSSQKIRGPISVEEYQALNANVISSNDPAYRIRGSTFLMWPDPTSGHLLAYEYVSTQKVRSSGGTAQVNWQADGDTCLFREDIVTLGLIWRYKKAKGRAYTDDQAEYERRVVDAIMRDGSKPRVSSDAYSDPIPRQRRGRNDVVIS
jgi:hypothetical protein